MSWYSNLSDQTNHPKIVLQHVPCKKIRPWILEDLKFTCSKIQRNRGENHAIRGSHQSSHDGWYELLCSVQGSVLFFWSSYGVPMDSILPRKLTTGVWKSPYLQKEEDHVKVNSKWTKKTTSVKPVYLQWDTSKAWGIRETTEADFLSLVFKLCWDVKGLKLMAAPTPM